MAGGHSRRQVGSVRDRRPVQAGAGSVRDRLEQAGNRLEQAGDRLEQAGDRLEQAGEPAAASGRQTG